MKRSTIIIALVIIVLIIVVIPTFNYYVLQRPIKADADEVVMQPEQMPANWTFIQDRSYLLYKGQEGCEFHAIWQEQNSYEDPALEAGGDLMMRVWSYELVVWSEQRYDEMMDDWGDFMVQTDGLGEQGSVGFFYTYLNNPNGTGMYVSSVSTTYIFREANVLAFIQFKTEFQPGDDVFEPRYDWMDDIAKEQAEMIHEENTIPWV
jgi:hypothetical protein